MARFPWAEAAAVLATIGTALWLRRDSSAPSGASGSASGCTEAELRARVVEVCRAEVGKAELPKYFADAAPMYVHANEPPNWCGIFALWALHQAGLLREKTWVVARGFLETAPALPRTESPQPGDVAYYDKNQHQAVVLSVDGDQAELANGNGYGGVVSLGRRPLADARAYYSIKPAIDAAIAKGCA
jgi:hypothetical protein